MICYSSTRCDGRIVCRWSGGERDDADTRVQAERVRAERPRRRYVCRRWQCRCAPSWILRVSPPRDRRSSLPRKPFVCTVGRMRETRLGLLPPARSRQFSRSRRRRIEGRSLLGHGFTSRKTRDQVLYQGTTSVVPLRPCLDVGL